MLHLKLELSGADQRGAETAWHVQSD